MLINTDNRRIRLGIRIVAVYEAAKALLLFVVGFGLLSLINRDVEAFAVDLVRHLHLNPVHKYPRIFIETAKHATNLELWLFALLAFVDAAIRSIEAIGLWYEHDWAKWLGVVTAGIFIPVEIYETALHFTWLKLATLVTNLAVVAYLGYDLRIQNFRGQNSSN